MPGGRSSGSRLRRASGMTVHIEGCHFVVGVGCGVFGRDPGQVFGAENVREGVAVQGLVAEGAEQASGVLGWPRGQEPTNVGREPGAGPYPPKWVWRESDPLWGAAC